MIRFLCKKFIILICSFLVVLTLTFFLMKALPGDPFQDERITPEVLKTLYAHYGLDKPIYIQYFKYIRDFITGDLGYSMIYSGRSVKQLICDGLPVSARLGAQALLLAILSGIFLGCWAALHRSRWQDSFAMGVSTIGFSVPNFVIATLLQYFIALKLHLLPLARWGDISHTILPTFALAALPTAFIARLMRSNLVEVLQQDYIRTAMAKGLSPFRIVVFHGIRNAILPVISYLGPVSAHILTGSFIVERVFAIPGMGEWMIHSIFNRDYPVIMGITVLYSAILLITIFLSDVICCLIDPRVSMREKK